MKTSRFILLCVLLMLVQTVMSKYAQIGQVVYVCILPAIIMSVPTAMKSTVTMLLSFVCAMMIDMLAEGYPGLNASAAVLCAFIRKPVLSLLVDDDVVARNYSISFKRYGFIRIISALAVLTVSYLLVYCIIDGAGFVGIDRILLKILFSSLVSLPLGVIVVNTLCPYRR